MKHLNMRRQRGSRSGKRRRSTFLQTSEIQALEVKRAEVQLEKRFSQKCRHGALSSEAPTGVLGPGSCDLCSKKQSFFFFVHHYLFAGVYSYGRNIEIKREASVTTDGKRQRSRCSTRIFVLSDAA
jgi:hypothetical protein